MILFFDLLLTLIIIKLNEVQTLDILGIYPFQGKSHFLVFEPYLQELARRGHHVTVISYFPQKLARENYSDISLVGNQKIYEGLMEVEQTLFSLISMEIDFIINAVDNCETLLANENVQRLVKSQSKFDVVLVEAFYGDCALGLAHKIGGPVIAMTTHMTMPHHYDRFGIPDQILQLGPATNFLDRLFNTLFIESSKYVYKWFVQNEEQKILAKYYDDIPPLEKLGVEIKLLLVYTHHSMYGAKSWPEHVKEVGGYHVMKTKPLPDKLKKFVEKAEHGVIFISFGSTIKTSSFPQNKLEAIISALSELPQRVVWKWDEDSLPGNPKNIYLSNWLPQNDILGHPNTVAFFSHCGLSGTTEAMHYGIPIIGLGVQLQFDKLTKETLLEKFKTVLHPEFRKRAKAISREFHDRPMSAMNSAIFWTEYVVRNSNSTLRTAAVGMPRYQLAGLDIVFVISCLFLIFLFIMKNLIVKILGKLRTKLKKD